MKNFIKFIRLFLIMILLSSCKLSVNNNESINNSEDPNSQNKDSLKSKMELKYSCGEDGISEFLSNGWIIVEEFSEEKICTWKSSQATKDCDMEKDKGCKITVPDKIGEEKTYILEK